MLARLLGVLLVFATISLHAQAPARGRGQGGGARRADDATRADLDRILLEPAALDRGRRVFESRCGGCHGLKGEGARGPALAQPHLPRAGGASELLKIIQFGIPGAEMPATLLQPDDRLLVVAYVESLGKSPVEAAPGDPVKGAELFTTKGGCMQCHTLLGHGVAVGPDLGGVGRRRSVAYLRTSLVEPSAAVPQSFATHRSDVSLPLNFLMVRVKPRDGEEVEGVRVNEDTFSIQLRDLTGRLHSFHKAELTELHRDWGRSPMPSYGTVFTPSEIDDIVGYLVSLRGDEE